MICPIDGTVHDSPIYLMEPDHSGFHDALRLVETVRDILPISRWGDAQRPFFLFLRPSAGFARGARTVGVGCGCVAPPQRSTAYIVYAICGICQYMQYDL
jgi:hypothetical protein